MIKEKMTNQKGHLTKIKHAQYHFNNMKEKVKIFTFEEFNFELCSFIQTARNITFAMQKDYSGNKVFDDWYSFKVKEMNKDRIFKFFNSKRVSVVHKGDPGSNIYAFGVECSITIPAFEEAKVILTEKMFTGEEEIKAETKDGKEIKMEKRIFRVPVFPELDHRPVIEACQEYLDKIEMLVEESQHNI